MDASFAVPFVHRLRFTENAFESGNGVLDDLLVPDDSAPARVLVALDEGVQSAWSGLPAQIDEFLATRAGRLLRAGPIVSVPGGEACKNDRQVVDSLIAAMHAARLCRRSYVLVVGGGAVLDAVGFAASTFQRGVRLVRMPSTTLSQADSGVNVKNAVNLFGLKNLIGAFNPPWAVVNDERLLTRLGDVPWRDGFAEAVKVALLKDAELFRAIRESARRLAARDMRAAVPIIRRSAQLHLQHITSGGDPFEFRNARPLDFGHWAAHKLEQLSGFGISHGHAVAIGLALDTAYAELSGLAEHGLCRQVVDCLLSIGLPVWHPLLLETDKLLEGLEEFRQHLGGALTITLVRTPGVAFDLHEVNRETMSRAVQCVREFSSADDAARTAPAWPVAASTAAGS